MVLSYFNLVHGEKRSRFDFACLWVCAALAALVKSPLGLALPGVVIVADIVLERRWGSVGRLRPVAGMAIFLALAAPWYAYMLVKYGGRFFDEFFLHHNLQRAFTGVHGERGGFVYYIRQLGYGMFPWVALVPLGIGWLARILHSADSDTAPEGGRGAALGKLLLLWFFAYFATFTLMVTKFHHYIFPAVVPLAMLAGISMACEDVALWRLLAPAGVLLLAVIANDIVVSAAPLSNLCTYAYERPLPEHLYPGWWMLLATVLAVAGLLWSLRARGAAIPRTLVMAAAVACAGCLSFYYLPALGHHMSQKDLFDTYERLRKPGDRLYQYQMNWRGEVFYSRDRIEKLGSEAAVERVLKRPGRVFIVSVADAFSAIDRAARRSTGRHLHVLSGSNIRYTISSNRLDPGEPDLNPIAKNLFDEKNPPQIQHPVRAELADGVAFLGYDISPQKPHAGGKFTLTLYWKCLRPVAKDWRVFVHVDGYGHEFYRINGDHDPVGGLFPTSRWMPGDIVRDSVVLRVPFEYRPGRFTIYVGMYIGPRRMRVLPGFPQDGANRIRAGFIDIE
ncbi:MAG: hypothetical protein D6806_17270 [Deltaproteobacteria bacterium]|nr:MAG: hypothetical protein D6806_17270 [Deltaproteobacteria bacterium]